VLKWALPLLLLLPAIPQVAMACSSVPGWTSEATYDSDDAIVLAEVASFTESHGADGSLSMESLFRVVETIRGDVPAEGTAVEILAATEPAEPNPDGVVFEIACSSRIALSQAAIGRPHLLFLQPMADGRWQVRWGSTATPDPATPAGEFMLSEVRRFASQQRPR
jgi:hypothetical protein